MRQLHHTSLRAVCLPQRAPRVVGQGRPAAAARANQAILGVKDIKTGAVESKVAVDIIGETCWTDAYTLVESVDRVTGRHVDPAGPDVVSLGASQCSDLGKVECFVGTAYGP